MEWDERRVKWVVNGAASGEMMSVETALTILNELFSLDPEATTQLFSTRVKCAEHVGDHPEIVCRATENGTEVGILGVLNGILQREDPSGSGIAAIFDLDTKKLVGFGTYEFKKPT